MNTGPRKCNARMRAKRVGPSMLCQNEQYTGPNLPVNLLHVRFGLNALCSELAGSHNLYEWRTLGVPHVQPIGCWTLCVSVLRIFITS